MKETHTVESLRGVAMTEVEKATLWKGVMSRIGVEIPKGISNPQELILSPCNDVVRNDAVSRLNKGGWMIPLSEHVTALRTRKSAAVASMLFIALSTGTSALAQGSLPGTTLYPIKIHINEEIEKLFTFTLDAKASLENRLTLRRLDEIQALMQRNMLTPALEQELDRRIELHSRQFEAYLTALPSKDVK